MVTFEDTEGNELPFSVHFSDGYDGSIDLARVKDGVFYLTQLNPEAIELDLVIFTTETSETRR
jgi:hypothetical protein